MKGKVDETWKPIGNGSDGDVHIFLSKLADLKNTPPEPLVSPLDFNDVTAIVMAEEGKIQSPSKLKEILNMRDEVYKDRKEKLHWNLSAVVETQSGRIREMQSVWDSYADTASQNIILEHTNVITHEYNHGTFVAMRPESDEDPYSSGLDGRGRKWYISKYSGLSSIKAPTHSNGSIGL